MLRKLINHKFKKNTIICIGIIIFISVLNFMSVYIKGFADIYRKYVFVHISSIFSWLTNIYRYSVGEVMITMIVFIVLMGLIIFIAGFMKYKWLKSLRRIYFKIVLYILIFIYATETLNCFILYHTTTIENTLYKDIDLSSDISDGERLIYVYNTVVDNINKLSSKMKRDSDGDLIKNYSYNECKAALRNISDRFTCLSGYYPSPKEIYYSDIMTQQYLAGIYFPFSMEANYNKLMYISNMPSTICHELSHLKGYIRENEANYLSFVACIESDNEFLQYSGYLSVFYYLLDDIETYTTEEEKTNMHKIDKRAYDDTIFVKEEVFNEIEEKSFVSTDTLSDATDKFIDSNLKINGVTSGMDNYNEVVRLLIFYYFGNNVL
jgi:hypothetical protein